MFVDGLDGSQSCGLPHHHIHGLHADAAIGDVRGTEADRHQDILGFFLFGSDAAIGNIVRTGCQVALHVTLILHHTIHHIPAAVVGVHGVGSPGNGVVGHLGLQTVVLGHHQAAQHAACLTDV